MGVFYGTLIITYVFSLMSRLISRKSKIMSIYFAVFVVSIMIIVSGLRNNIGDTSAYTHSYSLLNNYTFSFKGEWGFNLLQFILYKISTNSQLLIIITSLIINLLNIKTLYKYEGYFELKTYLYITSGYYLTTMNGIRQSLVAAILFSCTRFIIKGNFKMYLIAVMIMLTFHQTAIIMVPVYFIVRSDAWSPKVYKFIFLFLVGLIFYEPMMNMIFNLLGNTKYGEYTNFNEGGTNIIRVAIYAIPIILAYLKREQIKDNWPGSNIFVNMSLLNLLVMCFSLNNWIFARFAIYFELYSIVLLAYIVKSSSRREEKVFLYYGLIVAYFIYFWYEHVISLNIIYKSNFNW